MTSLSMLLKLRRAYGARYAASWIANRLLRRLKLYDRVEMHKEKTRRDAERRYSGAVKCGPFASVQMGPATHWGQHDVLSKILGAYEAHIVEALSGLSTRYRHFIDIGAADGYFVVGALKNDLFATATAFEIASKGQRIIAGNADLNGVGERLTIHGEGTLQGIKEVIAQHGPCAVLCDIEGAEFDLLTSDLLDILCECTTILELHDGAIRGAKQGRASLLARAERHFDISFLNRPTPVINECADLAEMHDDERFLAFSEGRPKLMDWVLLSPKGSASL